MTKKLQLFKRQKKYQTDKDKTKTTTKKENKYQKEKTFRGRGDHLLQAVIILIANCNSILCTFVLYLF